MRERYKVFGKQLYEKYIAIGAFLIFCEEGFREWRQKGHSGRGGDHSSIEIMSSWADAHF